MHAVPIEERVVPTCITLPRFLLQAIDKERGDVTRSRYILRLIQRGLEVQDK